MKYANTIESTKPIGQGFTVTRTYEAVENPSDVQRDEKGVWKFRVGAICRVQVTIETTSSRHHVALVDPYPAGCEPLNPALGMTDKAERESRNDNDSNWWYWSQWWYDHQNLRDDRAEVFTTNLLEGFYSYTYFCRATTCGRFVVPGAKAEQMYEPETFGRSASDVVVVVNGAMAEKE